MSIEILTAINQPKKDLKMFYSSILPNQLRAHFSTLKLWLPFDPKFSLPKWDSKKSLLCHLNETDVQTEIQKGFHTYLILGIFQE